MRDTAIFSFSNCQRWDIILQTGGELKPNMVQYDHFMNGLQKAWNLKRRGQQQRQRAVSTVREESRNDAKKREFYCSMYNGSFRNIIQSTGRYPVYGLVAFRQNLPPLFPFMGAVYRYYVLRRKSRSSQFRQTDNAFHRFPALWSDGSLCKNRL